MLARVAESVYWLGRNLERCENYSRYYKVHFFSSLEAPMIENKDFVLRSILFMSGSAFDEDQKLSEPAVWERVLFDLNNPNSLLSLIKGTRENARSVKNSLSAEVWESINKLYHYCNNKRMSAFSMRHVADFSDDISDHIAIIKSSIANTLLHDDVWNFINIGCHQERALQVLRIVRNKMSDWTILSDNGANNAILIYQWTILLRSLKAFDIYKNYYRGKKSAESIYKLILGNDLFPRSVSYSCERIRKSLVKISAKPESYLVVQEKVIDIMDAHFAFQNFEDEDAVIQHIEDVYSDISNIHKNISKLYFK